MTPGTPSGAIEPPREKRQRRSPASRFSQSRGNRNTSAHFCFPSQPQLKVGAGTHKSRNCRLREYKSLSELRQHAVHTRKYLGRTGALLLLGVWRMHLAARLAVIGACPISLIRLLPPLASPAGTAMCRTWLREQRPVSRRGSALASPGRARCGRRGQAGLRRALHLIPRSAPRSTRP
jgi:hypothetical protein